jgi:putative ABC transport system permease protein
MSLLIFKDLGLKGSIFNESESNSGASGYRVLDSLFEDIDPLGKSVRVYGQKFTLLVFEKRVLDFWRQ